LPSVRPLELLEERLELGLVDRIVHSAIVAGRVVVTA
jgi:hypothetical protein